MDGTKGILLRAAEIVEQGHCKRTLCLPVPADRQYDSPLWLVDFFSWASREVSSEQTTHWCLRGAIIKATAEFGGAEDDWRKAEARIKDRIKDHFGHVTSWNDYENRTTEEVIQALRDAAHD